MQSSTLLLNPRMIEQSFRGRACLRFLNCRMHSRITPNSYSVAALCSYRADGFRVMRSWKSCVNLLLPSAGIRGDRLASRVFSASAVQRRCMRLQRRIGTQKGFRRCRDFGNFGAFFPFQGKGTKNHQLVEASVSIVCLVDGSLLWYRSRREMLRSNDSTCAWT